MRDPLLVQAAEIWARNPGVNGLRDKYPLLLVEEIDFLRSELRRQSQELERAREALEKIKTEEIVNMVGDGIPSDHISSGPGDDATKFTSRVLQMSKEALAAIRAGKRNKI